MPLRDLNDPFLRRRGRRRRARPPIAAALLTSAGLLAIVSLLWVAVVDDPAGGRAVATARILAPDPPSTGSVPPAVETAQDEPAAAATQLAALPFIAPAASAEPGLIEHSAFGPLPRVSPDGRRPREAYAGRSPDVPPGVPKVAIVVGGMGLSQTGTQAAIAALPETVTLAFAPYGSSLQRWVDEARADGHEVLLQIPMEPLGYPEEDPGEHTLLVTADRYAQEQDLNWSLGRMTSYAGVMNYMGARFTGEDRALAAFLAEIGRRGLFYLDDGSSAESLAAGIGEALSVPVVSGDLVLDRDRRAESIWTELAALEAIARTRGVAVGVASAFPESVEAIGAWVQDAETRGLVVVPASSALPQ
jgi:polysaccharide deacetylase 2 family uncharacterized protein YibQ